MKLARKEPKLILISPIFEIKEYTFNLCILLHSIQWTSTGSYNEKQYWNLKYFVIWNFACLLSIFMNIIKNTYEIYLVSTANGMDE